MQQKDGRYRSASAQAAIREQVIDYLKKQRGTQNQAAEIFGLHIRSVNRMWGKYKAGGSRNIKEKKRGIPPANHLLFTNLIIYSFA
ncbi:MAG: helix-turn-helix domain-containing protein [Ginsengibacter sp.]